MSSLRAKRMARNHRRIHRPARLNLVALMDIFTILVLFLMVNNGDVEILQADRKITLPESVSEQRPDETLTIKVNRDAILLQGEVVSSIEQAMAEAEPLLPQLQQELRRHAAEAEVQDVTNKAAVAKTTEESDRGRPVIIMGDETMPYALLQRIMSTCAAEDFRDISLAVTSVPGSDPHPADFLTVDALGSVSGFGAGEG